MGGMKMDNMEVELKWKIRRIHSDWIYFTGFDLRIFPTEVYVYARYERG